jgi:hypothetical protein
MLDRQKLEAILTHRFPTAATAQVAAAANAVMGLTCGGPADRTNGTDRQAKPTTTIAVSADIQAPVRAVFDLFTDLERVAGHVSSITRLERLTSGGFALGTRWRETRDVLGRPDTAEMEVIAFERDRTFALSRQTAGVRAEIVCAFEPAETGTCVTLEFTLDGAGLPPGLLMPLSWAIAGKIRHALHRDLTDLKAHLESRARSGLDR